MQLDVCMYKTFFITIFVVLHVGIIQIAAQELLIESTTAVFTTQKIVIDGNLNEDVWQTASRIDRFIQREPEEGESVSESTIVRILYDADYLYLGFECRDRQPGDIIATEMRRDENLLHNDCIEIYLDTYHDHRSAFYFATNALGARRDGIILEGLPDETQNWDWNGIWDASAVIDSVGWRAEVAIPFRTLRFDSETEVSWGLNIARFIPRKREEAFWAPIRRDLGYYGKYHVASFGHLDGLRELHQPDKWEVKPFTLGGVQRDFEIQSNYDRKFELGLDARYLLTPNLTATLTLNTDFAQVEADQERVNLTRFELFFPEKREFFLEGANTFRFGERYQNPLVLQSVLFFSRRIGLSEDNEIVPLIGGLKLTGKESGTNVGVLNIVTDSTSYINDDDEPVKITRSNYTVARFQQDIFSNSNIGIIGVNQQSLETSDYARNLGVDATIFFDQQTQSSGFLAKSWSPDTSGQDYAGYLDFLHMDDLYTLFLGYADYQANFEAETGFIPRTDIRKYMLNGAVSPRPDFLNLRQVYLFNDFTYITDHASVLQTRTMFTGMYAIFNNGSGLLAMHIDNYERLTEEFEISDGVIIPIEAFQFGNLYFEYQSDLSKPVSGYVRYNFGEFYDGRINAYGGTLYLKTGRHLRLDANFDYNDVRLPAGDFQTTIVSLRMVYSFTPDLYLKPYIQWNSTDRVVSSNVLFNWHYIPGSDLYFVYNEEINIDNGKTATNNRTVLAKLTYMFNF